MWDKAGLQRRGPLHEGCFLSLRVDVAAPASSQDKRTPLHAAAHIGHLEVAKVLLAAGANVHAMSAVSVEGWGMRLDYRHRVPYMKDGVG